MAKLTKKQKKIAALASPKNKITREDLKILRKEELVALRRSYNRIKAKKRGGVIRPGFHIYTPAEKQEYFDSMEVDYYQPAREAGLVKRVRKNKKKNGKA